MSTVTNIGVSVNDGAARTWSAGKTATFVSVVSGIVLLDLATKLMIQRSFRPYQQMDLIGDYLRLTYIQNPGAAFGIHLGPYSRLIFLTLSLVALAALAAMYWATPVHDKVRLGSIALICGGAVGNLVDRVRSVKGVVDFLDIGIGTLRWPIFNVADIAVTTGAVFLAISLWQEESQVESNRAP